MAEHVPFVNREEELGQIEALIGEWGTRRVLCIQGPGGIGKTRLLQEVRKRYADGEETSRLRVIDIIDFDDRTFHIPQNVGRRIATALGEETSEPYMRGLLDWRKMEIAGVSPEAVEQQSARVNQILVDNFNEVSSKWRIVLLLDTTDALEGTDVWNYVSNLALQMENVLFLVAGRNAKTLWEELKSEIDENAQLIELPPLEREASEWYLQQKQKLLHATLAPEIARKLLLLARGRPILIDLAIEWISRAIPLSWLIEGSLEELESLSVEEMKQRQKDFEAQLVRHITQIRTPMDRLTLVMSRVYPLDVEMIVKLLKVPEDETRVLFEEAQNYTFVKSLPGGRISLHDEMRHMVNEYVWPEVDLNGDRRRRDSWLAAKYLGGRIQALKGRIDRFEEKVAREKDAEAELNVFAEREALERELWGLEEQRLRHILLVDIEEGVKVFVNIFDGVTQAYRFHFRGTLLAQVQQYVDRLSPSQRYELNSRHAMYLFDIAKYARAEEILSDLLKQDDLSSSQQVEFLLLLGNTEIRLGNISVGVENFEKAVNVVEGLDDIAKQAEVQNALGWGYRRLGQFEKAVNYYNEAHELIVRAEDTLQNKIQHGWILNNMAYVYGRLEYKGLGQSAIDICDIAEKIWQESGHKRGLGALYVAYMTIYRRRREYDETLKYGDAAWGIFEPQNDIEWLCKISYERGIAYWGKKEFQKAKKHLEKAASYQINIYMPETLYWLAETYISTGEIELAAQHSQRGYSLASDPRNSRYHLYLLSQLAHIADLLQQTELLDELYDRYQIYEAHRNRARLEEPTAEGLFFYFLGNIALETYFENRERSDVADRVTTYYQKAFPKISKHIVYGDYRLPLLLDQLDTKLNATQDRKWVEFRRKLGRELYYTWHHTWVDQDQPGRKFSQVYPQALEHFLKWQGD